MKKLAKPHPSRMHVVCPFCDYPTDAMTSLTWCGNCGVEWYRRRDGQIVFDDKRKTPRLAWGKAVQQSGGVSLGAIREGRELRAEKGER